MQTFKMARSAVLFVFLMVACLMVLNVNAQQRLDRDGKPCLCATTDDLRYVCGSDGKTYLNKSELDCENKCQRSNLKVRFEGKCETGPVDS